MFFYNGVDGMGGRCIGIFEAKIYVNGDEQRLQEVIHPIQHAVRTFTTQSSRPYSTSSSSIHQERALVARPSFPG
jgi:hypothetical protein